MPAPAAQAPPGPTPPPSHHRPLILLTGAAGQVGTFLRNSLGGQFAFRCFDLTPLTDEPHAITGDVLDLPLLEQAMQGVSAVIHLAVSPGLDQPWQGTYATNIGGSYNVFEAAQRAGVKMVLFASTTAVLGWDEMQKGAKVSPGQPVHPTTYYGIGKATGEMLGRYYAEKYQMDVFCLRIGSFYIDPPIPQGRHDQILRAWCSPEDLSQMVCKCLAHPGLGFQVFYVVSNNRRRLWSIDNAKKLVGYKPTSNAEDLIQPPQPRRARAGWSPSLALLVNAAVLPAPAALEHWQRWLAQVDLKNEHLDTLSYRLLPLVYFNLAAQGQHSPGMPRLKGVYRRAWLENQITLNKVKPLLAQMQAANLPLLALDDLAALISLYDGQGARRLYSLDLLARPEDIPALTTLLAEKEIWPHVQHPNQYLQVETPLQFWAPFDLPFSLAWRAFGTVRTPAEAEATWQASGETRLGDLHLRTPDPETLFLRACLRAQGTRPEAAFFALVDAAWMLNRTPATLDTVRLLTLARLHRLTLPAIETLQEIASLGAQPAATGLLIQFKHLPVSVYERLEHSLLHPHRPFPNPFTRLARRLVMYHRAPKLPGSFPFLRYLLHVWGIARPGQLPRRLWAHLRNSLKTPRQTA